MANIVMSIGSNVAKYLAEPITREVQYFLCVNNVVDDLELEKGELTTEKDDLLRRVEQAKQRAEEPEEAVKEWLRKVEDLLKETEDLERLMNAGTSCFYGWCPTWRRYLLCKQMAEKVKEIKKLKGKSNIHPFSRPAPLPGIQYEASKNFTYFESTKEACNQLWKALHNDCIYITGVHGMGGSGKTTLVTEVGKEAKQLNLFQEVVSVTVSQTPNIRSIQGKMADMLRIHLNSETEDGRAQELWMCLNEKKSILIIVDDIWDVEKFSFNDIGIRLDNNDYKSRLKVLLTTREKGICDSMECQETISLGLLSEDESWTLFRKHANIDDGFSKSLNNMPRKVCDQCKGLPLAIKAVGSSLRGKSADDWKAALHRLMHSEVNASLNERLKLSYDYLKNPEAELIFLMCSMFPEDYEISIEDLIRYAIGLGLGGRCSLDIVRSCIRSGINKLLDSCLLMHGWGKESHVKMHDILRDVALSIAKESKDHKILVTSEESLSALMKDDTLRDCFAVSSWYEKDDIYLQTNAPNLKILLINNGVSNISCATYKALEEIKVFTICNWGLKRQPLTVPILSFKNLQTLRLYQCYVGDISFVANLKRLKVLDLTYCTIKELPIELGDVKSLKMLDLSGCEFLEENYNGAIGKCSELEEVYISVSPPYMHQIQISMDIGTLPKLQSFSISTSFYREGQWGRTRFLELFEFDMLNMGGPTKNLLQKAEVIRLRSFGGKCKSVFPDIIEIKKWMNDLRILILEYGVGIECLLDATSYSDRVASHLPDALIPKLFELHLIEMVDLKELCRMKHFFQNLEKLIIRDCPKLCNIFPPGCKLQNLKILKIEIEAPFSVSVAKSEALFSMSTAKSLHQLEELTISGYNMEHIIACERDTNKETDPSLRDSHSVMPKLSKIYITRCFLLKSLFPICCGEGLKKLQRIKIYDARSLKYVFGECYCKDRSSDQVEFQTMPPSLQLIKLELLPFLVGICNENYSPRFLSLKEVNVTDCPTLTYNWISKMGGSCQGKQILNQPYSVRTGSSMIWMGHVPIEGFNFQCLMHFKLGYQKHLKYLFSMKMVKSLPELVSLELWSLDKLEKIITEDEELEHPSHAQLFFPKLKTIRIDICHKLKSIFPVAMVRRLPQLSNLTVSRCNQMEEIFRQSSSEDDTVNGNEIVLPNLTKIQLEQLPNFVDICKCFKLQATKLQRLYIFRCPKSTPSLIELQVQLEEAGIDALSKLNWKYGRMRQLGNRSKLFLPTSSY